MEPDVVAQFYSSKTFKRGPEQFKVVEEQLLEFQEDLQYAQKDNHKHNEDSLSHVHWNQSQGSSNNIIPLAKAKD